MNLHWTTKWAIANQNYIILEFIDEHCIIIRFHLAIIHMLTDAAKTGIKRLLFPPVYFRTIENIIQKNFPSYTLDSTYLDTINDALQLCPWARITVHGPFDFYIDINC